MATARYSLLAVLVAVTVAAGDLVDETVPPPPPSPTSASTSTEGLLPPGTVTEPYPESTPVSLEALHQCGEQTKYDTNWELLNAIDVEELLLQFGGPAGQLNDSFPRMDPADLPLVWGPHGRYDLFVDFFERDPFSLSNERFVYLPHYFCSVKNTVVPRRISKSRNGEEEQQTSR
ncbi:uncharacterized protein LOC113208557 [Frankliniella occidentalis]|uniref:Uncharacterized protein LOC113208557 n=1 Tax=Frankliniella occidentalis TaxID=133901 RepID=A0A9C6X1C7_FRAOC|nr:uncharacterized protein LOC113208557 [Frankliniella occidentalis]